MSVFCLIVRLHAICVVSEKARRGCWIPWDWSYRWQVVIWMLGIRPRSSGRAASAVNCWITSLLLKYCFLNYLVVVTFSLLFYHLAYSPSY